MLAFRATILSIVRFGLVVIAPFVVVFDLSVRLRTFVVVGLFGECNWSSRTKQAGLVRNIS